MVPAANALTPIRDAHRSQPVSKFRRAIPRVSQGLESAQTLDVTSQVRAKAPLKVTAGGTDLQGYRVAGLSSAKYGWYKFNSDAYSMVWADPLWDTSNYSFGQLETAWVRDNRVCGFEHWTQYGYFWGQLYYEIDIKTGEILVESEDEDCIDTGWFITCAYDAENDIVYGYGTDDEEDSATAMFMKTKGTDPFKYEIIKDYGYNAAAYNKQCLSMCWNPVDKKLYGINMDKEFVTIAPDGTQTKLFDIDVTFEDYVTGLAYSALEDLYYWEACYTNRDGSYGADLYTINAKTKTLTKVMSVPGGDQFQTFYIPAGNVSGTTPSRAELKATDFKPGATTGTLTYTMPSTTLVGTPLVGTLDWTFNLDGAKYSNGQAAPGSEVPVTVSNLSNGYHTFGMKVTLNGQTSAESSTKLYVGADKPKAPEKVVLDQGVVRWSAVREGVNGGYINTDNLEYEVFLDGVKIGTTKRNSLDFEFPHVPARKFQAYVVAVCDGLRSSPTYSNTVMGGDPWQVPVDVVCTEEALDLMTIVNGNNDDETWEFTDWENGWYSGQVDDGSGTGDDWIILPAIEFPDASRLYSFYITCMKKAKIYPDTWLEVYYGEYPDVAMMNHVLMERFSPQSRDYKTYGNPSFKVPEAGKYYIGIRCITNEGMLGCIVGDIRVEDNSLVPESPALPDDIVVTPGAKGALEATVTFTMPSKTVDGSAIAADKTLTAVVTGDTEVKVEGKPGQAVTATVRTVQGDNLIYVCVNDGDIKGERAQYEVYTGVTVPGYVKNLTGTVSEDMMSLSMKWETPSPDKWGGYVDPETTQYFVVLRQGSTEVSRYLASTGKCEAVVTLPAGAQQDMYSVGVYAENVAGNNGNMMSLRVLMGTPYKLPMVEDFETQNFKYQPWVQYETESAVATEWFMDSLDKIATEWAGRKTVALVGMSATEDAVTEGMLGLPRFTTAGYNKVEVEVKYYAGEQAANLSFAAAKNGMTEVAQLGDCPVTGKDNPDEWKTVTLALPADMLGQPWVQLYLDAKFGSKQNLVIIEYINVFANGVNLVADINADGSVAAGQGEVTVSGYEGEEITICTAAGLTIAKATLDGSKQSFAVPAGVATVTIGTKSFKLLVK